MWYNLCNSVNEADKGSWQWLTQLVPKGACNMAVQVSSTGSAFEHVLPTALPAKSCTLWGAKFQGLAGPETKLSIQLREPVLQS